MSKQKYEILIVDDNPTNIDVLASVLNKDYKIKVAKNGKSALRILEQVSKPDLILLDVMMPEIDGYEVCRKIKRNNLICDVPIIFVSAKSSIEDEIEGFNSGAVDYIVKPISPVLLKARVSNQIFINNRKKELELEVIKQTKEINKNQLELINCLGRASEYKDNETGLHVKRMSLYSKILAESIGANPKWCQLIFEAAAMHDIGKIGIPDCILNKPGKLNKDEWEVMKSHVNIGLEIIGEHNSELLNMAREIIFTHHERWDGSGYPSGIQGDSIPLSGRITAIADTFDALTSIRPYKSAWSIEDAMCYIEEKSSIFFDPNLVKHFLSLKPYIENIYTELKDTL